MSRKILLKIGKNLAFLLIGLLLLYLAFRGNDFNQLLADLRGAKYTYVVISVLIGLVAYISRGVRWLIILEPMGYKPKMSKLIK